MSKRVLMALLTSFIGNHFYILFVTLVLLKIGYSATFVSFAIGATIIPNLILGPWLGRLVDKSNKVWLHTIICFSLALIVNLLSLAAFNFDTESGKYLVFSLMIIYNCFASPLRTILYQYIVPSLDENEAKSFIIWERYEAVGIFVASILGYLFLDFGFYKMILPIDGLTFIICGIVIHKSWESEELEHEPAPVEHSKLRSLLKENVDWKVFLTAAFSVLIYVLAVDSHSYNIGVLFFKQHQLKDVYIPLIMSGISLFNIFGSLYFEKKLIDICHEQVHRQALAASAVAVGIMGAGITFNIAWLSLVALVLLQVVEPIWSTTNNVLIRAQIRSNKMGEFFGHFRIARSLFTFAGIALYGYSQEREMLKYFVDISAFLIMLPILFSLFYVEKNNVQASKV